MQRTILFYGNCQAGAVAEVFRSDPQIASAFAIRHMASFDDPEAPPASGISVEDTRNAAVLFEQFDPVPFPYRDALPADAVAATFPAVDFNLLWPLSCVNPYNDPTPDLPWGHFPYGDRIIVDCVKRGLSADDAWEHYRTASETALPDLERFLKLERGRLAAREMKVDVKFSEFIFEHFAEQNLFWCVNHPTLEPLRALSSKLVDAIGGRDSVLAAMNVDATIAAMPPRGPLALISVPVHPAIAEHFGLRWYPGSGPHYGLGDATMTYDDYFRAMIACSIAMRESEARAGSV
jgi:hypothetical protein